MTERAKVYTKLDEEVENRIRAAIEAATLAMKAPSVVKEEAESEVDTDASAKENTQSAPTEETLSEEAS